jgi:hypothetical protein
MLGGRLNIESASGTGTVLIAELPLRKSTSEIENLSESNG